MQCVETGYTLCAISVQTGLDAVCYKPKTYAGTCIICAVGLLKYVASIFSQNDISIVLSPNPITNQFSISGIEQIVSLTLKDLNGKWIKSFDAQDKNHSMSNVTSGVYFLEVHDENRSYIIKVVKE